MPGGKFKLDEIERIAKDVSKKARYPINSSDELLQALGGQNASITYEGKSRKATEARQVPNEVFPIESEKDFVAKMASLRARSGDKAEDMPRGKKLDSLPPGPAEPADFPPEAKKPLGKAGYKGFK
jgi:hypothetical protein